MANKKTATKKKLLSHEDRYAKLKKRLEFFNKKSWVELPSQNDLLRALEDAMELVEDLYEGLEEGNLMKSKF